MFHTVHRVLLGKPYCSADGFARWSNLPTGKEWRALRDAKTRYANRREGRRARSLLRYFFTSLLHCFFLQWQLPDPSSVNVFPASGKNFQS